MRVLVAGASGYVGSELVRQLEADGHIVSRLTRGTPMRQREYQWNPTKGTIPAKVVEESDAIINLAGASIAKLPWTKSYQRQILSSRLDATGTITRAIYNAKARPTILLNASAVGFYGDRPTELLTEESARGEGFLAKVVESWEEAAHEAPADTRVVTFRTGLVVGRGGAFGPLGFLTKYGLAARIGSGAQHWPWIALYDEAAAIRHLLTSELSGPVNLEGPVPATSVEITRLLASAMGKPHLFALPEFVVKTALGTAGKELLLADQNATPSKLVADGFEFRYQRVSDAITATWTTE